MPGRCQSYKWQILCLQELCASNYFEVNLEGTEACMARAGVKSGGYEPFVEEEAEAESMNFASEGARSSSGGKIYDCEMEAKMDKLISAMKMLIVCVCVSVALVVYMLK
ncbi:hypothetical protein GQ55_5G129900 [Panicum hallii var. hallii]|uniref:Uncharacterized protein n=1 Tax=Panicum hallii var. hallii TaxID=1504633 RepID=A0A2T7DFR3_9POAL|nr:hypothetical protein GQ55_5G129900 [Panicum hallii var. hallii]